MAEKKEELNEGQLLAAAQQLAYAYQGFANIHALLTQYDQIKNELPELKKQKAALDGELAKLKESVASLKALHQKSLKDIEDEGANRKQEQTAEQAQSAAKFTEEIKKLEERQKQKESEAAAAEKAANSKIQETKDRVELAEKDADTKIAIIDKRLSEKQKDFDALSASLEDLKKRFLVAEV
jgi:chromosome segregation ATPase